MRDYPAESSVLPLESKSLHLGRLLLFLFLVSAIMVVTISLPGIPNTTVAFVSSFVGLIDSSTLIFFLCLNNLLDFGKIIGHSGSSKW